MINKEKYVAVIGSLDDTTSIHIHQLSIFLDSHLIVSWLNNVYFVCDPFPFWKYLHVRLLSKNFESIAFIHILKNHNQFLSNIAN